MQTPTSNEVVAMIRKAEMEQAVLADKIRDLKLRQVEASDQLKQLRSIRNGMIIEAMKAENVEVATVAIEHGVSGTWIWKLLKAQSK